MEVRRTLMEHVAPVIELVHDERLRAALHGGFANAADAVHAIEECFAMVSRLRYSDDIIATFLHSWKASHLKMLAIYGLSCRLQRLAMAAEGSEREDLFIAAARNAETSHEDLGLDFDAETHAELYDEFAASFLGSSAWQADRYCIAEAAEFKRWIYRNMVIEPIATGLLTNMFSEIYNHAEYSIALPAFAQRADDQYHFTAAERERALLYIGAHVENDTEVDHFLVVVEALDRSNRAAGASIDYAGAEMLFTTYLRKLGAVMSQLGQRMIADANATTNPEAHAHSVAEGALLR